jgi:superfamily II DNA or RNA helicase
VLPTGSGKTVLFFSLAAIVVNQTVIVIVPFAALVDDLILRAREIGSGSDSGSSSGNGLTCQE